MLGKPSTKSLSRPATEARTMPLILTLEERPQIRVSGGNRKRKSWKVLVLMIGDRLNDSENDYEPQDLSRPRCE